MNYCSQCGEKVKLTIPEGDNRQRFVCVACYTIHYQNPKVVGGCIASWQDKVLLCQRAIEPRHGLWTLPAGFMENGETNCEGAMRETMEEANAKVENPQLFCLYSIAHISQVYTMYRANVIDGIASPGIESLAVKWVKENEVPWDDMAFFVVSESLRQYYKDKKSGKFKVHYGEIIKQKNEQLSVKYF